MKLKKRLSSVIALLVVIGLCVPAGCAKKKMEEKTEAPKTAESETPLPAVELPAPVQKAIEENFPEAEIASVEKTVEDSIALYDIEFKEDRGEMEATEDGTVLDLATIITLEDLPEPAAAAIRTAAEGFTIGQIEKSEIRSEIEKRGEKGKIVKLDNPRYVYEAELAKNDSTAEITVDSDGNIVEPLKWEMD